MKIIIIYSKGYRERQQGNKRMLYYEFFKNKLKSRLGPRPDEIAKERRFLDEDKIQD